MVKKQASRPPLEAGASETPLSMADAAQEYAIDAMQRWTLFLDVLRQRGNNYVEIKARTAPHVLSFGVEVILDGRSLPRPVNYASSGSCRRKAS
jgi:hypothetical protein